MLGEDFDPEKLFKRDNVNEDGTRKATKEELERIARDKKIGKLVEDYLDASAYGAKNEKKLGQGDESLSDISEEEFDRLKEAFDKE